MLQSIQDGYEFERVVCQILYKTNPYHLSHYDGGPDRGRDICVQYLNNDRVQNVIVECKFYQSGVSKEVIMPALNWATVHQPDLLYLWIIPYLTPSAKDFVQEFEKKYKISVRIEEKINIEEYLTYIHDESAVIWTTLRKKILKSCIDWHHINAFVPEYELNNPENSPFLIDRESERKKLFYQSQKAFYLQGVSACGKTQLLKYVAFVYVQKGVPIFWHTIRPGTVEQQCSDFFHTLARYFESVHHDQALIKYFDTYGFFVSQDLENLVISMLKKHAPILFFDDVHNCQNENISMHTLFEKLIKNQASRMYFSGWFNIFNLAPIERKYIDIIILEGLKKDDLDLIIQHCSGERNSAMAELIEQKYYGLPGYAVLTNKDMSVEKINASDDFLAHFLALLSPKEKILLFTLSLLSTDVSGDFLRKQGFTMQLVSLENKRIIVSRKCRYAVHDKYRTFFLRCTIDNSLISKVVFLIEKYAAFEPAAFLDLINYRITEKNYISAWDILSNNFQLLISCQFFKQLLKQLQEIELNAQGQININEIVLKKIVLLERLGEYNICLQYISLLGDRSIFNFIDQETIFYIQLRCLYFTNQYDKILELYKDNYSTVEDYTDRELYIQILLIIGRVFYIRGSSKGALIYYLLAYQHARMLNKRELEVKAIHRIAMIERRWGLAADSRKTFQELLKLDALITPKRRSYILFRIAKCYYNEGNLEEAEEYNKRSIKIKESYNDTRGLLFSDILNAMICYKKKSYLDAYFNSSTACERADGLDLHKEWLCATLVQFRTIQHEISDKISVADTTLALQRGLQIAIEEKLLLRLKTIEKLTNSYCSQLYLVAKQNREMVEAELKKNEDMLIEYYIERQDSTLQQDYETLIFNNTAISHSLLLRSGFADPLQIIHQ